MKLLTVMKGINSSMSSVNVLKSHKSRTFGSAIGVSEDDYLRDLSKCREDMRQISVLNFACKVANEEFRFHRVLLTISELHLKQSGALKRRKFLTPESHLPANKSNGEKQNSIERCSRVKISVKRWK